VQNSANSNANFTEQNNRPQNPIKLLIYSHFFPPSVGGVETITLALARGLAELRVGGMPEFAITVVTQTPQSDHDDTLFSFSVIRQPGFAQLRALIKESDLLHVAGPALGALFCGWIAGKPMVLEHHGFQAICPNGQLLIEPEDAPCPGHFMAGNHRKCLSCNSGAGWLASGKLWILTFVRRFFANQVKANITPTRWLGGLLKLPNVIDIPHGIEANSLVASSVATTAGDPVIAFQGRLVTTKGVRLLFEAALLLRERGRAFQLLIIGDGPERASLEHLARETNLAAQVTFAGRLPKAQLEGALSRAFVVVVPSLGGEVFGLVLVENMQRSLPIVASDLGAFTEVLGGAGVTFRTGEAGELARQLELLLDDPAKAVQFGRLGHQRMLEFFGRGRMIEKHASVYRRFAT